MSRLLTILGCCALLATPSAFARGDATVSWAQPQIRYVVQHGLMAKSVAAFRADDTLTQGELAAVVAGLTKHPAGTVADPGAAVTVTQLDARLVRALDLSDAAAAFNAGAHAAGLATPSRFGTETVARLLGLRTNHPAAHDDARAAPERTGHPRGDGLLGRSDPALQGLGDAVRRGRGGDLRSCPRSAPGRRKVLNTAVRFIGFPYVWGGTSEKLESPFGVQAHGGFDCSGFVWRVYKLQAYPGGAALASTLKGRTTYQMSGEVPAGEADRLRQARAGRRPVLRPFGPDVETGLDRPHRDLPRRGLDDPLLGPGRGLTPLTGWYRQQFAWGRRPLAEAGLIAAR